MRSKPVSFPQAGNQWAFYSIFKIQTYPTSRINKNLGILLNSPFMNYIDKNVNFLVIKFVESGIVHTRFRGLVSILEQDIGVKDGRVRGTG